MFGRRVPKSSARVAAYGAVDELSAALGLARAASGDPKVSEALLTFQRELIAVMGELATDERDRARYLESGYAQLTEAAIEALESMTYEIELQSPPISDWILPGGTELGARLHFARTVCRRAERSVHALFEATEGSLDEDRIGRYLNRLGDALWALALSVERG